MARDSKKLTTSNFPTYAIWYERFIKDLQSRMGDDMRPHLAISVKLLLEMLMLLKVKYIESDNLENKLSIAELGILLCRGFWDGLPGEDIMKITLNETLEKIYAGLRHTTLHMPMTLEWKFKRKTGIIYHLIPVSALTKSRVKNVLWFTWLLECKDELGHKSGWLLGRKNDVIAKNASVYNFFSMN